MKPGIVLGKIISSMLIAAFLLPACTSVPAMQGDAIQQYGAAASRQNIALDTSEYWTGDGGSGESIAIMPMDGRGLGANEQLIPEIVQGELVQAFDKYSAMAVLDRATLEQIIREGESDYYAEENKIIRMGEVIPSKYQLSGTIRRTPTGLININLTVAEATGGGLTRATFNDNFQIEQIDDLSGIRKAANGILGQMGIQLTAAGQMALMEPASSSQIRAQNALARGVTAQRQGTEVAALSYYFQAASYDPSLLEAVNRSSILNANISSGSMGDNIRNDIAWRDQWVERLTETEQFFDNFNRKESMPYTLFYISDEIKQQGEIDYQKKTVTFSIDTHLHGSGIWTLSIERALQAVYDGLRATGRADIWGLGRWPQSGVTNLNAFGGKRNNFSVVFELINDQNKIMGRQTLEASGSWGLNWSGRPVIDVSADDRKTVNFQNVSANDITDRMTIRIATVNRFDAETAARNGVLQIRAIKRHEYNENDRFKFARGEVQGFSNRTANDIGLFIPDIIWGDMVISIGNGAFRGCNLSIVNIPGSVITIGDEAFQNNAISTITIPNSVTSIGDRAFRDNKLHTVNIGSGVRRIGEEAFYKLRSDSADTNRITKIAIGSAVTMPGNAFRQSSAYYSGNSYYKGDDDSFWVFYNQNGQKAGTYSIFDTVVPVRSTWIYDAPGDTVNIAAAQKKKKNWRTAGFVLLGVAGAGSLTYSIIQKVK